MELVTKLDICRVCATFYVNGSDVEFVSLFEPPVGLEKQLEFIFNQLKAWQIHISSGDGLPQFICANCFTQFRRIQSFRTECEEANHNLLQTYGKLNLLIVAGDATETVSAATLDDNQFNEPNVIGSLNESFDTLPTFQPLDSETDLLNDLANIEPMNLFRPPLSKEDILASLEDFQLPETQVVVPSDENFPSLTRFSQDLSIMGNKSQKNVCSSPITTFAELDIVTEQNHFQDLPTGINSDHVMHDQIQLNVVETADVRESNDNSVIDLEEVLAENIIPKKSAINENINNEIISSTFQDIDVVGFDEIDDDMDQVTRLLSAPFACQYCYCPKVGSINHLMFSSSDALSQHFLEIHDPNLPYTCPYCSQKYVSAKQRDYHVQLAHTDTAELQRCEYCQKTVFTYMDHHQLGCTYVGNWKCETCGENFTQVPLHEYRAHQRHHQTSNFLICKTCNRVFKRRANLEAHERVHRAQGAVMVSCDECKSTFPSDYDRRRHKYQMHSGELPVKCDYCKKGFVSMAFLTRHLRHIHPGKYNSGMTDAAACIYCGTIYDSIVKLRQHQQETCNKNGETQISSLQNNDGKNEIRQRQQTSHNSPHYTKRFKNNSLWNNDLETHKPRLFLFQCTICSKDFVTTSELLQHMQMHSSCFEFSNNHCDSTEELNPHENTHKDLNYRCSVASCNYETCSEEELINHKRTKHRLVQCEYCGDFFAHQRLAIHLRIAHHANNNNNIIAQDLETHQEWPI